MEYSDGENESDVEMIDDILGPEDLFNDEAEDDQNNQNQNVGEQNDREEPQEKQEDSKKNKVEQKIKQPRTVRNSRVTLNYNTLKGNNGLNALKKLFKNFKFKGNGHEKEDLVRIMGILQQWMCYQLCPSYDFESCMLHLEALGKKRIIQVLMKKYRLGMDEWGENTAENENNVVENNVEITENSNKNEFDLLLDEEMANVRSEDELGQNEERETQNDSLQSTQIDSEISLTPEQLERIARNRKLAEERRLKRMSERCEVNQQSDTTGEISLERINLDESS